MNKKQNALVAKFLYMNTHYIHIKSISHFNFVYNDYSLKLSILDDKLQLINIQTWKLI